VSKIAVIVKIFDLPKGTIS